MNTPDCILILGMHRSGTSVLASVLHGMGISFGSRLKAAAFDNQQGFFEDDRLVQLNNEILRCLGQTWHSTHLLPENWTEWTSMQKVYVEVKSFLKEFVKKGNRFALKDPRLSLTFPLWEKALQELGVKVTCLIMLRHPQAVIQSIVKRNHFAPERAGALWLKYTAAAEQATRKIHRHIVIHEEFLNDPFSVVHSLKLFPENKASELAQVVRQSVHPDLVHHFKNNQGSEELFLEKVYQAMTTPAKNKTPDMAELCQSAAFQSRVTDNPLFALLKRDFGEGYEVVAPCKVAVRMGNQLLDFAIEIPAGKKVKSLKLLPTNQLAALVVGSYSITNDKRQAVAIQRVVHKCLLEAGGEFIFDEKSFFEFYLKTGISGEWHFTIQLKYLNFGQHAHQNIHELGQQLIMPEKEKAIISSTKKDQPVTKFQFWWSFAITALKSPFTLVKHLNRHNLQKLKRAIANESPRQILTNFKLFLQNGKSKNSLDIPVVRQVDFQSVPQALAGRDGESHRLHKVLFVFQDIPDFDQSSGGKRAFKLLTILQQWLEVVIVVLGDYDKRYEEALRQNGIEVLIRPGLKQLKKRHPVFQTIIFNTYRMYDEFREVTELYPAAKTIIDSVDVHWLREERAIGHWEGMTEEIAYRNKGREIAAYQSVDEIWTVTRQDAQVIASEIPNIKVVVVSNIHEPVVTKYSDNGSNNLLFLGNYNHHPNISAVRYLVQGIFPKVKAAIPDAQLFIAGANAPEEVRQFAQKEGVVFKGFVPEGELKTLYEDTFLSVAPLLSGAGIKGKIGESIAYKTPVLTNAIGNEGIELVHEQEGLISDQDDYSGLIVNALNRKYNFERMTNLAQNKIAALVGVEVVERAALSSILPVVNICIVTWNRLDLLKKCLDSILKNTIYPNYHFSILSNGCTDGTQAFLQEFSHTNSNVSLYLEKENTGFVRPNNQMMLANEMEVVLLNNDVEVTKGWLCGLYRTAYQRDKVGVVGSKILYPDGVLQEFGATIYKDGSGVNIGKNDNPNQERFQKQQEVGYVSGCAMYIKRSTIERIGVFDDDFHPCYFEDSDYCYRAKSFGLATMVTPDSVIYHHEGATAGTETGAGFKRYQQINRQKFLARHQKQLS